jgi:hypothetical protein
LYLEKPSNAKELSFLVDCIESLLDKEQSGGFRGVQSKSLVDLIQLECLSGSSSALKITNGKLEGTIWVKNGELIDAVTQDLAGEEAFKRILSWKTGSFEIHPMDSVRTQTIFTSYQGLLLDSVQALDEAQATVEAAINPDDITDTQFFRKEGFGRIQGVEFALKIPRDSSIPVQNWGLENPEPLANWVRKASATFSALGEKKEFGPVQALEMREPQRHLHVLIAETNTIVIGMLPNLSKDQVEQNVKKVLERWAS